MPHQPTHNLQRPNPMQYKTIILQLIEDRPSLHHKLASSDTLLSTLNRLAAEFRSLHLELSDQLSRQHPELAAAQVRAQALEYAVPALVAVLDEIEAAGTMAANWPTADSQLES